MPAKYSTFSYQGDADAYSYQLRASIKSLYKRDSNYHWLITAYYSPLDESRTTFKNPDDFQANPLLRPTSWWWDREVYTENLTKDKDGKPLLNTANQPFDETIEQEATRGVLVAEKNVATLNQVIATNYTFENSVNQTTWNYSNAQTGDSFSAPPRSVLCREASSGQVIVEGAYRYYRLTMRFAIQQAATASDPLGGTWDRFLLNTGFKAKDPNNLNAPAQPVLRKGKQVSEPVLLKQDGSDAEDDINEVHYVRARTRPEVDYNALNGILT